MITEIADGMIQTRLSTIGTVRAVIETEKSESIHALRENRKKTTNTLE